MRWSQISIAFRGRSCWRFDLRTHFSQVTDFTCTDARDFCALDLLHRVTFNWYASAFLGAQSLATWQETVKETALLLTDDSANWSRGFVPGDKCGRNGSAFLSMFYTAGLAGFISSILLIPFLRIFMWSEPKSSSSSRPVEDFMCILPFRVPQINYNIISKI